MRRFRSSSSRSCLSCKSTSVFSDATDGEGLVGRGNEFALEEPTLWLSVSTETALDGDKDLVRPAVLFGTSRFPLPVSQGCA